MKTNCPSLNSNVVAGVSLEDLEGDVVLAKSLTEQQATKASAYDQNMRSSSNRHFCTKKVMTEVFLFNL